MWISLKVMCAEAKDEQKSKINNNNEKNDRNLFASRRTINFFPAKTGESVIKQKNRNERKAEGIMWHEIRARIFRPFDFVQLKETQKQNHRIEIVLPVPYKT